MLTQKMITDVNSEIIRLLDSSVGAVKDMIYDSAPWKGHKYRTQLFVAFGGAEHPGCAQVAAVIEVVHLASLVHDDILDNAQMRRGRDCLYRKHNLAESILFGDLLLTRGLARLVQTGLKDAPELLINACTRMAEAEIQEQHCRRNADVRESEYMDIIAGKTGALFGAAAGLGSMSRSGNEAEITTAISAAELMGCAYQILDDCTDYMTEDTGKDRLRDFRTGVITLPLITLFQKCTTAEHTAVLAVLGNDMFTIQEQSGVLSCMKKYGVMEESLRMADACLDQAEQQLSDMSTTGADFIECREILEHIRGQVLYAREDNCDCRWRVRGNRGIERIEQGA